MTQPAPDVASEKAEILAEAYADPVFFCHYFLEQYFTEPVPWFHRGILSILTRKTAFLTKYGDLDLIHKWFTYEKDGETQYLFTFNRHGGLDLHLGAYTLIMLPRGTGKTTVAGVAVPLYEILYQDIPFTVYVSHAAPHAKMQLNNVKRELTDNDRIREMFGVVRPELKDDEKWSEEMFETLTGVAMAARGRGGQIRGLIHRGHRPKKIIVDDLEDKESVNTALQREKTLEWFYGDLMPALPHLDPEATVVVLGTLLHSESLLSTLQQDPTWSVVRFGAKLPDGSLLWPRMYDEESLEQKKQSMAIAGQIHTFYMEFMNESVAPEVAPFNTKLWIYEKADEAKVVDCAIHIDPATSPKRSADRTAIVVARRTSEGIILVSVVVAERGMSEKQKTDAYFDLHRRYKCLRAGVESVAYQAALISTFREAMFRKNHYFEITPVSFKTRKTQRIIDTLVARIANGYIRFERKFPIMEMEAADFRSDTDDQKDDCLDALACAVSLLDPTAAYAAGKDVTKDIYKPLDEELGEISQVGWVH
jgi:hypothetical protein